MKKKEKLLAAHFYWNLYNFVSTLATFKQAKCKINKKNDFYKRDKKKGTIIIYNHASNIDHFISGRFFKHSRVNYVVTRRFAYNKKLNTAFGLVKAIVRDQFKADLPSILKIRRVVELGGNVCIAPSGQVTIHGGMTDIHPSIVKLIKMCKADVYALQMTGTYLNYPKWSYNRHGYPVSVDCVKILEGDKMKEYSDDYIYDQVVKGLNVDDRKVQKEKMIKLKSKNLVHGFTESFYMCPKCHTKYQLSEVDNNKIVCNNCHNEIIYNQYGFLEHSLDIEDFNETKWFKLQEEELISGIKNKTFVKESKVELYSNTLDNLNVEKVGDGILHFDSEHLYYDGTFRGENLHKDFDLSKVYQFPFKPNTRFNIPDEDHLLEFVPENKIEVTEWGQIANSIYKVLNENA